MDPIIQQPSPTTSPVALTPPQFIAALTSASANAPRATELKPHQILAAVRAAKGPPARVRGHAWRDRQTTAGTAGEPLDYAPTEFAEHLRSYSDNEKIKGNGTTYTLSQTRGGWTDAATDRIWGLCLDSDGSPAYQRLLDVFRAEGIAAVVQGRGEKHHAHVFFNPPLVPGKTKSEKTIYSAKIRYILTALGTLAGVSFDHAPAGHYAPLVYAYTKRPDLPGVVVETLSLDGAAIDPEVLLISLGFRAVAPSPASPTSEGSEDFQRRSWGDRFKRVMQRLGSSKSALALHVVEQRPFEAGGRNDKLRDATHLTVQTAFEVAARQRPPWKWDDDRLADLVQEHFAPIVDAQQAHPTDPSATDLDAVRIMIVNAIRKARAAGKESTEEAAVERDRGILAVLTNNGGGARDDVGQERVRIPHAKAPERLPEVVDASARALARNESVFTTDRVGLVRLLPKEHRTATIPMTHAAAADLINREAVFVATDKDGNDTFVPQPGSVAAIVVERPELAPYRCLDGGVSERPIVTSSGEYINSAGYHAVHGGTYLTDAAEGYPTLGAVDVVAAAAALRHLVEPISDTPFEDLRLGQAWFAACAMTIAFRQLIPRAVPGFAATGDARGLGKTGILRSAAAAATGRLIEPRDFPVEQEMQKLLVTQIYSGNVDPLLFDNADEIKESPSLAGALTTGSFGGRILGISRDIVGRLMNVVLISGVNPDHHADFSRRLLNVHLTATRRPERFRVGSVEQVYAAGHKEYFRDLAVIKIGWIRAGKPRAPVQPFLSFDSWEDIRHALIWAGAVDPCGSLTTRGDATMDRLRHLIRGLEVLDPLRKGVATSEIAYAASEGFGRRNPALAQAVEGKHVVALGRDLRRLVGTPCDGLVIKVRDDKRRGTVYVVDAFGPSPDSSLQPTTTRSPS
jgi:hypothetical protein